MAFKKIIRQNFNLDNPKTLFFDLKNKDVLGLLDHQSAMIDRYNEEYLQKKDVGLELPTGSGKTLIGLLLGEYRRLKFKEKIVYLCPTKQLVDQVANESKSKYGIKTIPFTGKQKEYSNTDKMLYNSGDNIAITTYSGFFNNNTFFKDPDVIIFDDAHSCENYISEFWSVNIIKNENNSVFEKIINLLQKDIDDTMYSKIVNAYDENDNGWCDMISSPIIEKNINEIIEIIDEGLVGNNRYKWKNIREFLHACNFYVDNKSILIRPYIPPTKTYSPFMNAKQRIYMSATLGESGELERIIGIEAIDMIPIPKGWDIQSIGRRFFMFPNLENNNDNEMLMKALIDKVDRAVILVPDNNKREKITELLKNNGEIEKRIFTNEDIADSKKEFSSSKGIAILANRFDGIDFQGDECRLEFIIGLPKNLNIQEKFLITRFATNILFTERIKTRLLQALGRCTRGMTDYSVVCILDSAIQNELISPKKLKLLHPELQAEINFGKEQSTGKIEDFLENFDIFMERSEEWDEAEKGIIQLRNEAVQEKDELYDCLKKAAKHEVKYQYAIWKKDWESAIRECEEVLKVIPGDRLKGYRGYWNYKGYCAALRTEGNLSEKFIQNAIICTNNITWLSNMIRKTHMNSAIASNELTILLVENLEKNVYKFKQKKNFERRSTEIMEMIDSTNGKAVEEGIKKLGELIGFEANNLDDDGAPDTYWYLDREICIISECKKFESEEKPLSLEMIREAKTHIECLENILPEMKKTKKKLTVIITNSKYLHDAARNVASGLYYINIENIKSFAQKMFTIIRELIKNFENEGELEWRQAAEEKINKNKVSPKDIIDFIEKSELKNLKSKN